MQDLFFGTTTVSDEEQCAHTYSYWLITHKIRAGRFTFEDYGVRVVSAEESADLPHLTHSRTLILKLLHVLMKHSVSPVNLYDVAVDWAKENHLPQPKLQQVADAQ